MTWPSLVIFGFEDDCLCQSHVFLFTSKIIKSYFLFQR